MSESKKITMREAAIAFAQYRGLTEHVYDNPQDITKKALALVNDELGFDIIHELNKGIDGDAANSTEAFVLSIFDFEPEKWDVPYHNVYTSEELLSVINKQAASVGITMSYDDLTSCKDVIEKNGALLNGKYRMPPLTNLDADKAVLN